MINETSKSEVGAFQLKYYAPGVGNIRTNWKGTDVTQETLDLTELLQLNPEAMAEARAEALKLESHAYEVSRDMYVQTAPAEYPEGTPAIVVDVSSSPPEAETPPVSVLENSPAEIVVYASDLPENSLTELDFVELANSPGGKMISLPNNGDELDPPPENDPHVIFSVQVNEGMPYRCWIHMKVGELKGKSQANVIWVQFSGAVDQNDAEILVPGSSSYMTAQGPQQEGWTWVGCDMEGTDSLINFQSSGDVTVRLQAGMEGVGFDQFILSSADFLEESPNEAVVEK